MALTAQPPLPAPPINPAATGLLGFLGIKSGGRQPTNLTPNLVPVLDLEKFYRAGQRSLLFANAVAAVQNGAVVATTVPVGKCWIIEQASALSGTLGAVAAVTGILVAASASGNANMIYGNPSPKGVTGEILVAKIDGPFILVAGDSLAIISVAPAAPTAFNWQVHAYGVEVSA